jgi:hypothetical protein
MLLLIASPILFFMFMVPYLVVGARYARNQYALQMHNYRSVTIGDAEKREIISKLTLERDLINHKSYCFYMTPTLRKAGHGCANCTTENSRNWERLTNQIREAEAGVYNGEVPTVGVLDMLTWPSAMTKDYLKGGEVKKPNYSYIARKELEELGFKELELK